MDGDDLTAEQRRILAAAGVVASRGRPTHLSAVGDLAGVSQNTVRLARKAIEASGREWPMCGKEEARKAGRAARRRFDSGRFEASMARWRSKAGAAIHGDEWAARQGRSA